MRDKILFFVLGAVLATFAYFIGDADDISALENAVFGILGADTLYAQRVVITEDSDKDFEDRSSIVIGVTDNTPYIDMINRDGDDKKSHITLIATKTDLDAKSASAMIRISGQNDKFNFHITDFGITNR